MVGGTATAAASGIAATTQVAHADDDDSDLFRLTPQGESSVVNSFGKAALVAGQDGSLFAMDVRNITTNPAAVGISGEVTASSFGGVRVVGVAAAINGRPGEEGVIGELIPGGIGVAGTGFTGVSGVSVGANANLPAWASSAGPTRLKE